MEKREKLIKSEVVQLFKTTKETLRHYEKVGLLKPEIDENNYRYYDVEEMNRLRQIFLFKDLGFSIEEMKALLEGRKEQKEYLEIVMEHNVALERKIEHLEKVKNNLQQLMGLLKKDDFSLSFKKQVFPQRTYYAFNPFETLFLENIKCYYDTFRELIESASFSERQLISMFEYDMLANFNRGASKVAIEYDVASAINLEDDAIETVIFPSGEYLSIFYIFTENNFGALTLLKQQVDAYLKENALTVDLQMVIEIEHPEFAMILPKGESLYEVQLKIK